MRFPALPNLKPHSPLPPSPLTLLTSCTSLSHLHQALSHLLKSGLTTHLQILTKFASLSAPLSSPSSLLALLSPTPPDTFLLNTLIRSLPSPLSSFCLLLQLNLTPNNFTFPFLLKSLSKNADFRSGVQVHAQLVKFRFADDEYVRNSVVYFYAACGYPALARRAVGETPGAGRVAWSALIGGCVRSGFSNVAVDAFREMQVRGVRPDGVTVIAVLSACADLGALGIVRWVGRFVEREGIERKLELSNALVDALAKCGDVDGARKVFEGMTERNIVSWTAVIDGLAAHGRGREAVEVFESMRRAGGVVPDDVVFIGVLSACSHAGMVDAGCRYFDSMRDEYGIVPKIEHYGCMIDLFGRAGLVDRALGFVKSMPMRPNSVILRTLLAACRTHGRHEDGARIACRLIEVEPTQGSNYVLSSNIYAASQQWEKKTEMRAAMSNQGIWKIPGCSMLEVGCEVYEFVSGDKSHPEYKEILEMVEEVGRELRKAGYAPTTSEVLLDIDEEDKEDAVHRHSEKLAIAFALLKTPPGTTIRIVKNLRVCLDCHSATKFISKVYGREIVVRDRSRFHRFKDGECSCKDFW